MKIKIAICILFLTFTPDLKAQTKSQFSENSLKCIVLLEKKVDSIFVPHGTGFLIYDYSWKKSAVLVTCEHVLRNSEIYICLPVNSEFVDKMQELGQKTIISNGQVWTLNGNKIRTKYELVRNKTFTSDKNLDIGVLSFNAPNKLVLPDSTILKATSIQTIPKSEIAYKKFIPLGMDVYFTGFPLSIGTELGWYNRGFTGLYSESVPNPLVRKGSVAWKSDTNKEFLLDAFSYGGNSGSPIFTINDLQNDTKLIGMVIGHLPSEKSDNIGLARCVWIDDIMDLIKVYYDIQ
jgi:hypothetical protein